VFDSELDVLLEVQCSFGNEGVSVAALRQKYEKEWGNDIKVEESEEKLIVDKRFSVIPISKKEASKVLDMAMTGDPLEQLVLGAVLESSPANLQAGVNRDAEMYYKNQYAFNITGGGVNVCGTYSRFAWYAFVSNRKFNQLVDEKKQDLLKDRTLCPAGLIIDAKGGVEKKHPIDSEEVVSRCAQEHIAEIKKCDDMVYGVAITGLKWKEISNALRKKALEEQQKKDNETKKKQEEKALDF